MPAPVLCGRLLRGGHGEGNFWPTVACADCLGRANQKNVIQFGGRPQKDHHGVVATVFAPRLDREVLSGQTAVANLEPPIEAALTWWVSLRRHREIVVTRVGRHPIIISHNRIDHS